MHRKKKLITVKIFLAFVVVFLFIVCAINYYSDNKLAGNVLKTILPNLYKYIKKSSRLAWFNQIAQEEKPNLHSASGWGYLSTEEFNRIIDDVLKSVTIKENDSIFEFGCGTGAVLKRILETHSGTNIVIGGSDISINAIEKAQSQTLLAKNGQFYVISMTAKNELIADNTQDLVISFGAFAMYLFKEEMIVALKEALRIAKPGANLCFTHFIEPGGNEIGSILEPIEKHFWLQLAKQYSLKNMFIQEMILQGDRYYVCFTK